MPLTSMVSPKNSGMTDGLGSGHTASPTASGPGRTCGHTTGCPASSPTKPPTMTGRCGDIRADEHLVLDDQRYLVAAMLQKIRQALGDQARFKIVADEKSRSNSGIGVDAGDADGVVMVPAKPRALVERIVVLRLIGFSVGFSTWLLRKLTPC